MTVRHVAGLLFAVLALGLLGVAGAFAQASASAHAAVAPNGSPLETVSGKIQHIWTTDPGGGFGRNVLISVRQPDKTVVKVIVAPPDCVRQSGVPLKKNNTVTITGSRVIANGVPLLLARRVDEGGVFTFRDTDGRPLWNSEGVGVYHPDAVQTVTGKIQHVWVGRPARGHEPQKMLSIRRPDNTVLTVALAPSSFIDERRTPLLKGAPVTITGSLVMADGRPLLVASRLQQGGQYAFRDGAGNSLCPIA